MSTQPAKRITSVTLSLALACGGSLGIVAADMLAPAGCAQHQVAYAKAKKSVKKKAAKKTSKKVYIAPYSGTKYHYHKYCRGLRTARSIKTVPLTTAKRQGYTLCGWER